MKMRTGWLLLVCGLLAGPAAAQSLVADDASISSVEERRILVSIEGEYAKLRQREETLQAREMELKTLEQEVDKKLAQMKALRQELERLLNRKQAEEGQRVAELSKIYEKMDSRKAATLLKDLEQRLAIDILAGMKKKTAGKLLDNLDAKTAAKLSKAFTEIPVKQNSGY